jgi:uncharacterized Zn finger protein
MKCPICDGENFQTLKAKHSSTKTDDIDEFLLKCDDCQHVFKSSTRFKKPRSFRLIISENESSIKTKVNISPDDTLYLGDTLLSDLGQCEIKSLELKSRKRVKSTIANDIDTIWASSIDIPSRVGIAINFKGLTQSYKVDLDREFRVSTEDIIKIEYTVFKVKVIKTLKMKMTKGSAKSSVIRRVYGEPMDFKKYDYDLSDKIASKKEVKKR